jgi:hypothetical protein
MINLGCSLSCKNTDELCELLRAISALLWLELARQGRPVAMRPVPAALPAPPPGARR